MRDAELFTGSGGTYHVYNRGVDKRIIFQDDADRVRFLNGLALFNDHGRRKNYSIKLIKTARVGDPPCVEVVAYCLMPNHFHLMLRQRVCGGVSEFMGRLGNGYTKYFNKRHERSGRLFESAYKAKRVETTGYAEHLTRYIHLNPLELDAIWTSGQRTWQETSDALSDYKWSSYRHFIGMECSLFVRNETVMKGFKNADGYQRFIRGHIATDRSAEDARFAETERG